MINNFLEIYKKKFNLQNADFSLIEHNEAIVATVYLVLENNKPAYILKICSRPKDFWREAYFLDYFRDKLPVPKIFQQIAPAENIPGAVLMEYLPGSLLSSINLSYNLIHEMGSFLAHIHAHRMGGYGDLTREHNLKEGPIIPFTEKFKESFAECSSHLPQELLERCYRFYENNSYLLKNVDGPCICHRDFRLGNIIAYDNKIHGIIDWSSACSSFAEDDLSLLENEKKLTPDYKDAFLKGYAAIRPVPEYKHILPLLHLNQALAVIGFTVKKGTWNTKNVNSIFQL